MPWYHFDLWESDRIVIDDSGQELSGLDAARKKAIDVLGDAIRDHLSEDSPDRVAIDIRADSRFIMTASAVLRIAAGRIVGALAMSGLLIAPFTSCEL